jgi:hypothetical protein
MTTGHCGPCNPAIEEAGDALLKGSNERPAAREPCVISGDASVGAKNIIVIIIIFLIFSLSLYGRLTYFVSESSTPGQCHVEPEGRISQAFSIAGIEAMRL